MSVTVLFDFRASASASQGQAGSKLQAAKTPWATPRLGALVPDLVATEVDVGDRTVGLQGSCQCLSAEAPGRAHRLRLGFYRS